MREYFKQKFLFEELEIDDEEYPSVEIQYTERENVPIPLCIVQGYEQAETSFLLTSLMEIIDVKEWERLLYSVRDNHAVVLIDDIPIYNEEVEPYKQFYLKTFYYWLKKNCDNCYVYQMNKL